MKHASLKQVIAARTIPPIENYGRQMALTVRRVSRIVAGLALLLMVGGQFASWVGARTPDAAGTLMAQLPGPPAASFHKLFGAQTLRSPYGVMSLGILALAVLPTISVILILVDNLRARRWQEALVAAGVVAILVLSSVIGP